MGAAAEAIYGTLRITSEPPMTRFLASQLAQCHYYNIAAARTDLGHHRAISTAEGMQRLAVSMGVRGVLGKLRAIECQF